MEKDQLPALLARKMAGEATEAELDALQEHLNAQPEDKVFAEWLQLFWGLETRPQDHSVVPEQRFQAVLDRAEAQGSESGDQAHAAQPRFRRSRLYWAAAATMALLLGAWYFLGRYRTIAPEAPNEIVIRKGVKSKLILPDGSQVWLNSDSKLIYPVSFSDSIREVSLEGEAYFIVAKNPAKPFVVRTSDMDIHVIGTIFNVKSYPQDSTVEATLLHGSIAIEKKNSRAAGRIILRPREKLVLQKRVALPVSGSSGPSDTGPAPNTHGPAQAPDTLRTSVMALPANVPDSVITETSWVYGRLVFEGDRFYELARKMERWYDVRINIRDARVANFRFTGMLEDESLEEALRALQLTASFRYTIHGNEVRIDAP